MNWVIEAESLVKTYPVAAGTVRVLDGISLRVRSGEMLAVMGESGSGKTTLLNILGCLDRPDSGLYRLGGQDVSRLSGDERARIRNRRVGFIFQSFNLLPRLTALQNVELPLLYAGWRTARAPAADLLRQVGLGDRLGHRPNQLSGGQSQRVAIARALITEPEVILADEPTGNLDSRTSREIIELFLDLNSRGQTIVMVSHSREIAAYSSRKILMRDGRIVADEAAH